MGLSSFRVLGVGLRTLFMIGLTYTYAGYKQDYKPS